MFLEEKTNKIVKFIISISILLKTLVILFYIFSSVKTYNLKSKNYYKTVCSAYPQTLSKLPCWRGTDPFILSNKKCEKCVKGVYFVTMIIEIHVHEVLWYNLSGQPSLSIQIEHVCKMKYLLFYYCHTKSLQCHLL